MTAITYVKESMDTKRNQEKRECARSAEERKPIIIAFYGTNFRLAKKTGNDKKIREINLVQSTYIYIYHIKEKKISQLKC